MNGDKKTSCLFPNGKQGINISKEHHRKLTELGRKEGLFASQILAEILKGYFKALEEDHG